MTYLLDTNVIVDLTGQRGNSIRMQLEAVGQDAVAITAVTLAELEYGEAKSMLPSRTLNHFRQFLSEIAIIPFGAESARTYGSIRADLERKGTPIGGNDLLIAAIALTHNMTLVTRDESDFGRIEGLKLINWSS